MAPIGFDQTIYRRTKQCEVFLSKFEEELNRNPDADVTPYTQMLMAKFRAWNKKREREFISELFLDLYERNAQSLRKGLCKFNPRKILYMQDTAKTRFPRRALLTRCLYETLSPYILEGVLYPYIREDFSCGLVDIGRMRYEIDREKYEIDPGKFDVLSIEEILSEFKKEVCCEPDPDVTLFAEVLENEYSIMEKVCRERIIKMLFLNLYAEDAHSLEQDLKLVEIMPKLTPGGRAELLPTLYGALSSYIGEDFSWIIARCDKVEGRQEQ